MTLARRREIKRVVRDIMLGWGIRIGGIGSNSEISIALKGVRVVGERRKAGVGCPTTAAGPFIGPPMLQAVLFIALWASSEAGAPCHEA